jgi:hypothetical protein
MRSEIDVRAQIENELRENTCDAVIPIFLALPERPTTNGGHGSTVIIRVELDKNTLDPVSITMER